jgi:hypothetical protein
MTAVIACVVAVHTVPTKQSARKSKYIVFKILALDVMAFHFRLLSCLCRKYCLVLICVPLVVGIGRVLFQFLPYIKYNTG